MEHHGPTTNTIQVSEEDLGKVTHLAKLGKITVKPALPKVGDSRIFWEKTKANLKDDDALRNPLDAVTANIRVHYLDARGARFDRTMELRATDYLDDKGPLFHYRPVTTTHRHHCFWVH